MDVEMLKEALSYDPLAGTLTWRHRPLTHFSTEQACERWNRRYAGVVAGSLNSSGYTQLWIAVQRVPYRPTAQQVAWAIQTGVWPGNEIDHIDHDRANNRWANLREVGKTDNMRNLGKRRNNRSGTTGIFQDARTKKWRAQIREDGLLRDLGTFDTEADAIHARKAAEIVLNYHPHHGIDLRGGERPMFTNTLSVDSDDLP